MIDEILPNLERFGIGDNFDESDVYQKR